MDKFAGLKSLHHFAFEPTTALNITASAVIYFYQTTAALHSHPAKFHERAARLACCLTKRSGGDLEQDLPRLTFGIPLPIPATPAPAQRLNASTAPI